MSTAGAATPFRLESGRTKGWKAQVHIHVSPNLGTCQGEKSAGLTIYLITPANPAAVDLLQIGLA
jgi:hypothetical protein